MNVLTGTTSAGMGSTVIMLVLMIAIFYFMLIRPENKRKKEAEQMRGDGGVGDARRGGAHQNLRLRKLTVYRVRNGALDCLTHGGGGENEAVIAIDRAFDAARPGKRLLRAQKDRADGEQALSDPAADVHIHVPPVVFYS